MLISDFESWCSRMEEHMLPPWSELPDIDLYMDQVIALMTKYLSPFAGAEEKPITRR